ncbi:hypothetical protein DAI22_03g145850 [Oryza sativa Japonica Group]|nr:hypothetical protein DAI22_03g145850 [Oryza sativa Japonica Group]
MWGPPVGTIFLERGRPARESGGASGRRGRGRVLTGDGERGGRRDGTGGWHDGASRIGRERGGWHASGLERLIQKLRYPPSTRPPPYASSSTSSRSPPSPPLSKLPRTKPHNSSPCDRVSPRRSPVASTPEM